MRTPVLAVFTAALITHSALGAFAAEGDPPDMALEHPGVVALSQDEEGNWVYKSFPEFLPLYVFEGDEPGKSNCDRVCAAVWPLVKAD
ncbi:MAG: hypothetical protein RLN70_01155, partial [Rhodospirillaceae bacterium]